MNRAQRRSLKRTVAKAIKGKPGLSHPVPDSVVLSGGPMDGWIVKPDAPALEPDWRAKWIEETARNAHERARAEMAAERNVPLSMLPAWEELIEERREEMRQVMRDLHGAGRYELNGKTAAWVAE